MYNLQPRAAAATSEIRASNHSDIQIFTVDELSTASAIPPGSPEVTKETRRHTLTLAAELPDATSVSKDITD